MCGFIVWTTTVDLFVVFSVLQMRLSPQQIHGLIWIFFKPNEIGQFNSNKFIYYHMNELIILTSRYLRLFVCAAGSFVSGSRNIAEKDHLFLFKTSQIYF